eukprot:m51a1_g12957 hypothetical protein (104) ;mRNA; f:81-392
MAERPLPWANTQVTRAVALSVMPGGDVDTTAAITGAISGAMLGLSLVLREPLCDMLQQRLRDPLLPDTHDPNLLPGGVYYLSTLATDFVEAYDRYQRDRVSPV